MNYTGAETARIPSEYERREREIPADFYSWSKPSNLLMQQQTLRSSIRLLHDAGLFPLDGLRVADIGCGSGSWLLEFIQWGADPSLLAGIDLMPARIRRAHERIPQADLRAGNAADLPWPDASFDVVSQFLMFTSVLDPVLKSAAAKEMLRVVKPGGAILWFDLRFDNPNNAQVKGVRTAEIRSLFPNCDIRLTPALLAPPISRLIAPRCWALGEALHTLPFLRTHYAGLIRKP